MQTLHDSTHPAIVSTEPFSCQRQIRNRQRHADARDGHCLPLRVPVPTVLHRCRHRRAGQARSARTIGAATACLLQPQHAPPRSRVTIVEPAPVAAERTQRPTPLPAVAPIRLARARHAGGSRPLQARRVVSPALLAGGGCAERAEHDAEA